MTTPLAPDVQVFLPLGKVAEQDDGTLLVPFVASTESVDDQGEIVDYEAVKKAAGDYMRWAALREMHQPSAVGVTVSLEADDDLRKVTGVAHVVDPVAVKKVATGVYKGVSLGGRKLARAMTKVGGRNVPRVTEIAWTELSLVDRPSNADSILTLAKRSDAPDPEAAPEEAEMAKASETQPAAEAAPEAAIVATPTIDTDTTGEPLEKAAAGNETPEASESTTAAPVAGDSADAAAPEDGQPAAAPLAKSAADDTRDAAWILGDLNRLIENEAKEGDGGGVEQLRAAQTALVSFLATESAEVGTPADVAEAEAEDAAIVPVPVVIVEPMYYAAVIGDLAKRAIAGPAEDTKLDDLVKAAIAAGGHCGHEADAASASPDAETLAKVASATFEAASGSLLEKVTAAIGPIARPDDLEAVKAEILGALEPVKEELAKIASQPMPGGPLRYATDARRFDAGEAQLGADAEADVLQKAAMAASDPVVKEALGRLAAEASMRTALSNPTQLSGR